MSGQYRAPATPPRYPTLLSTLAHHSLWSHSTKSHHNLFSHCSSVQAVCNACAIAALLLSLFHSRWLRVQSAGHAYPLAAQTVGCVCVCEWVNALLAQLSWQRRWRRRRMHIHKRERAAAAAAGSVGSSQRCVCNCICVCVGVALPCSVCVRIFRLISIFRSTRFQAKHIFFHFFSFFFFCQKFYYCCSLNPTCVCLWVCVCAWVWFKCR